jgi:putative transposase
MRKSRFSEEQILKVLQEQEAGATAAEVCLRHGVSEWTFYRWKSYRPSGDAVREQ